MNKKLLSVFLSALTTANITQAFPAMALETNEPYPYMLFAASEEDGAITVHADNICMNGSIATNGTVVSTADHFNLNGQCTEHAAQEMIYVLKRLDDTYFHSEDTLTVEADYSVDDLNINMYDPIVSHGMISLCGNVSLNTQLKAEQDIIITGNSCNSNHAALISHYGDIHIDSANFGYSGLIYAPYGDISIESDSMNLNNVIVIGQTITIDCPNVNVNYNASAASIIGTISDDPDDEQYFCALGLFNEEEQTVDIAWFGADQTNSFRILTSADGDNYALADTVTDTLTYSYPIDDNFVSAYYKVAYTTSANKTVESVPFLVTSTEEGIIVEYPDSDDDGISDLLEQFIGTDPNKPDTDDDGLTDYQEEYITGTDPLIYDSAESQVSDADADSDSDGISNIDEIELETDPQNPDTDGDRLTDDEEISIHLTDPLLEDTDGDSLSDGFEIRYGLDPLNPYTDGISDAERLIEQDISLDNPILDTVNKDETPYSMSLRIKMCGDAEEAVSVLESGYSASLENDAQIGGFTDILLPDSCEPETIRLSYEIKEDYRDNTLNRYADIEDLQGIRRLCVFRYFDEISMLLPLETQYNAAENTVYADVTDAGTYCLMDLEAWFDLLDIDPEHDFDQQQTPVFTSEPEVNMEPINIYIPLQSEGQDEALFEQQIAAIEDFGSRIFALYPDTVITLLRTKCYTFNHNSARFTITKEFFPDSLDENGRIHVDDHEYYPIEGHEFYDSNSLYSQLFNQILLNDDVDYHFVYDFQNGSILVDNDRNALTLCEEYDCFYSRMHPAEYVYSSSIPHYNDKVHQAVLESNGIELTNVDTAADEMIAHINSILDTSYHALLSNRLKTVTLKSKLNPLSNVDTDEDTLSDWEEADTRYITVSEDGTVQLPTIQQLLSHIDINSILDFAGNSHAARYEMFRAILKRQVLPCVSDPTLKDSDGDGLSDEIDNYPVLIADNRFSLCDSSNYGVMPENNWVNERWKVSNEEYHSLVKEELEQKINNLYSYPIRGIEALLVWLFTDTKGCVADFGLSIPLSHLFSSILASFHNKEFENDGYLNYAPEALEHYFLGSGTAIHYKQEEICDLILSSKNNIDHLIYNITKAMQYAEHVAKCNSCIYFSTAPDSEFKLSCFDNKGKNCYFIEWDIEPNGHLLGCYYNPRHVDWHNTVGESFCGINAGISYLNGVYTMRYRYYLNDIYEWVNTGGMDDIGTPLHFFHEAGYAKQYLIDGFFEGEISWKEGDSALEKSVYDSIINTMHEIQGLYAELYDESVAYYEECQIESINYRKVR